MRHINKRRFQLLVQPQYLRPFICVLNFASRLDNGSSIRKILGFRTIARPLPLSASARPKVLPAFCPEPFESKNLCRFLHLLSAFFFGTFFSRSYMPYSQIRSYAGTVHNSETPLQYLCRMTVPDSSFSIDQKLPVGYFLQSCDHPQRCHFPHPEGPTKITNS